jgi:hypothetical protein
MNTEKKDEDPSGEEPALEFDGTRTDQLDDSYRVRVVSASENGKVEHDDRGQARWKWASETNSAPTDTGTFDMLKSLDNDALDLSEEVPAIPTMIDKIDGYNPYDTIIEDRPPKGFVGTKRNVKPR